MRAIVLPADGSYRQGDLQLVGGAKNWEGKVEIFWDEMWRDLTDSNWTDKDADVVCRQQHHSVGNSEPKLS